MYAWLIALVLIVGLPAASPGADPADLPSVTVDGRCVFKGMLVRDAVKRFSGESRWEFRYDPKMVASDGMLAFLVDRRGAEAGYLLQFSFTGKTLGEGRLTRIGWTGKRAEWTAAHDRRVGCSP